jgi:hypothetical protein
VLWRGLSAADATGNVPVPGFEQLDFAVGVRHGCVRLFAVIGQMHPPNYARPAGGWQLQVSRESRVESLGSRV